MSQMVQVLLWIQLFLEGQPINVAIGSYLPKIVVTIPFIGYLMAATKSIEGLIVLGLTVLFLIILYVIAELWKKDRG